jgi:hypothetical protein
MMPKKNQPCRFFQRGSCRFGENCEYVHELVPQTEGFETPKPRVNFTPHTNTTDINTPNFIQKSNTNICNNFLRGTCKNDHCK